VTSAAKRWKISPAWLYVGLSQLVLLIIGLHWAQPPTGIAQIDLPPPFDPTNLLRKTALAWDHVVSYYGSVDGLFSIVPYLAVETVLEAVAGLSRGQALLFVLPVMLSWLGAYRCARSIGSTRLAAFVAAWVYAFIPIRQQTIGVYLSAEACAAALPWIFSWAMTAARDPQRRRIATVWLASISCAALAVVAVTPQLLVASVLGLAAWVALCAASAPDRLGYLRWAGIATGIAVATSLWWLVPDAASYLGITVLHTTDPSAVAWTFARASLLNELRFCPTWVWQYPEYNPWAVAFDRTPWLYASGFVAYAGVSIALMAGRGQRLFLARWCALIALVMLFLAKGMHAPLASVNEAFFKLPGMFLLIEPNGLILVAALAAALACGLSIDAVRERIAGAGREVAGAALAAFFVGGMFVNNLATVTGAIFHEQTGILPDVHIAIPDEWRSLAARIDDSGVAGSVLVLPPDDFYQVDYTWGYHGVDLIPIELLRRDVLMPGAPFNYTQSATAASIDASITELARERSPVLPLLLRDLGIRFLVVRDDVRFMHAAAPAPAQFAAALGGAASERFGALELYDLGAAAPAVQLRTVEGDAAIASGTVGAADDPGLLETEHAMRTAGIRVGPPIVAALHHALAPERVQRAVPGSVLHRMPESDVLQVPALVGQVSTSGTSVVYSVHNGSQSPLRADLAIGAWPRSATTFVLTASGISGELTRAGPTAAPQWVNFFHVTLQPGTTDLTLTQYPARGGELQMFYPPRFAVDDAALPHVGQIEFLHITSAPAALLEKRRPAKTPPRGTDVNLPLSSDPSVTVLRARGAGGASTGWRIDVRYRRATYGCYALIPDAVSFSLGDAIRHCLASIGEQPTDAEQRVTEIIGMRMLDDLGTGGVSSLNFDFTAPVDAASTALLERSTAALRRTAAAGSPAAKRVDVADERPGIWLVAHVADTASRDLVIAEAFSPTWVALEFSRGVSFPAHHVADGWRNGWVCAGAGTVIVFNWLDLFEIIFAFAGICAIVIVGRSRRW
jgi:hypothetical protein